MALGQADVLDAQPEPLEQAQPGAVEERDDQAVGAVETSEDSLDLSAGQDDREPLGALGARKGTDLLQGAVQDGVVEE